MDSMSRLSGKGLATLTVSSGIAALLWVPDIGMAAYAQTAEESSETDTSTEPANAGDEEATVEPETREPAEDTTTANTSRFTCQMHNGRYTVMYTPESRPDQTYAWAIPGDMGSNWPAQRRCNEISARLESYRPDGLSELQTGLENGYNVVCVTTESVPNCRIVFTVPAGQDPMTTRDRVFENLTLADSGQQTQGVNTLVGGGSVLDQIENALGTSNSPAPLSSRGGGINLKPFLAPEDGGTGSHLTTGNAAEGRTLDPDNFR